MPLSRALRAGCKTGVFFICVRISGEALINAQSARPLPTMIEDCVRGCALIVPWRTPMQLKQLQFHCGNPPPAAEPKTRICITTQKRKKAGIKIPAFI